jgi:hypothetical protein
MPSQTLQFLDVAVRREQTDQNDAIPERWNLESGVLRDQHEAEDGRGKDAISTASTIAFSINARAFVALRQNRQGDGFRGRAVKEA